MGHYEPNEEIYAAITAGALAGFDSGAGLTEQLAQAWDNIPGFPMHCPEHHYLIAATLLSVYRKLQAAPRCRLEQDLAVALARSRNVLGGFCGFYGACGAAVGAGVFLSVFTDANPCREQDWQQVTGITARCLQAISDLGGPRCCKRVCYTALLNAAPYMAEHYQLKAVVPDNIICTRHQANEECIHERCPYYRA